MCFLVAICLQQFSPSGSGVRCSRSPCSCPGNCILCYTGPWCLRCRSPERQTFLHGTLPPRVCSHTPGPTSAPVHAGSRARGPAYPNVKSPEGESLNQALQPHTKSPHTKRETYHTSFGKVEFCSSVFQVTIWLHASPTCLCAWPGSSLQLQHLCCSLLLTSRPPGRHPDLVADFPSDLVLFDPF